MAKVQIQQKCKCQMAIYNRRCRDKIVISLSDNWEL